jgi:ketosteroid isomerase-like protein
MTVYENDVISMPPNQPPLIGKWAVRDMWESLLENYSIDASVQVKEVEIAGDWAYERGTYRMTLTPKVGGELIKDEGKYLDILRKQADGSWKYARVSWSSNLQ